MAGARQHPQLAPQRPLAEELARPALLERLSQRWSTPVMLVVAGPGFGKSTVLAQSVRANAMAPRGFDAWVSAHPGHEYAEQLGCDLVAALGCSPRVSDPLRAVLDALISFSPLDVCVLLDDVHEIPDDSSGAALLAGIVRRLPANAHIVLSSRRPPPVPLARLRAADGVVELTEHDLAFSHEEVARLAARLEHDPRGAQRLGGWPALVRLALAVRSDVAMKFAREEVLASLSADERRALAALTSVGVADASLVGRVAHADVDLDDLATRVPLIARIDETRFRAHDLWIEVTASVLDPLEAAAMARRAVDELAIRGELARAGAVAIAHGCWDALARLAVELVSTTVSALPLDTAARWLAAVPPEAATDPAFALLDAAVRDARRFGDLAVDALVDRAVAEFRARGDAAGEAAALAIGTVAAHARSDLARLATLAARADETGAANRQPVLELTARGVAAVLAEMQGDPEAAIEHLTAAPTQLVSGRLALAANRFLMHCFIMAGRADEAVAVADQALAAVGDRSSPAFARWVAGDPSAILARPALDLDVGASARDEFVHAALRSVIDASLGRANRSAADGSRMVDDNRAVNARDAALATNADAAQAIVAYDERAAAEAVAAFLANFGASGWGERHLRRFLALGYVLNDELRARWDQSELGPSHQLDRDVARALLAGRSGQPIAAKALDAAHVLTTLPLPWSVELAAHLRAAGDSRGETLTRGLADRLGDGVRDALRRLATGDSPMVASGARDLLARLPSVPARRLSIEVLGPLTIRFDGERLDSPVLRRARVCELLSVLVVAPRITRDRAIDLLWPELDPAAGARNLRVTLSHLRRVLEPGRASGEASYHLRATTSMIELVASEHLDVDAWELRRHTAEAARARDEGDLDRAAAHLDAATARWRGEPLTDLARLDDFEAEREALRLVHVASLLALGELRLATGAAEEAASCAPRALAIEPYSERAHRLAIAAHLQRRDQAAAATAVARAQEALAELGVTPEPATQILFRQGSASAGDPADARARQLQPT